MFKNWFRGRAPSPLCDLLSERTPEWFAEYAQGQIAQAEDSQKLLNALLFGGVLACAGSFISKHRAEVIRLVDEVQPDILAFEVLAFAFYAVRESHLPTPEDPLDDTDPEELVDGYKFVMGAVAHLISKTTSWGIDSLWQRRVLFYFQRPNMRDASEAFVGTLLTLGGAQQPSEDYGRLSLSLEANLKLRVLVDSYAATIPKGFAESLQRIAVEYGLLL